MQPAEVEREEPAPLQADGTELGLHGVPSVRICALLGQAVQTDPYVLQTLSMPLSDLGLTAFVLLPHRMLGLNVQTLVRRDILVILAETSVHWRRGLPRT